MRKFVSLVVVLIFSACVADPSQTSSKSSAVCDPFDDPDCHDDTGGGGGGAGGGGGGDGGGGGGGVCISSCDPTQPGANFLCAVQCNGASCMSFYVGGDVDSYNECMRACTFNGYGCDQCADPHIGYCQ